MNIFRKKIFSKNGVCKSRKLHGKVIYLIKTGVFFSLVGNYLRPSNNYRRLIFNINAIVLILIIC